MNDSRTDIEHRARMQDALEALDMATLWLHRTFDFPPMPSQQAESWERKARSGRVGIYAVLAADTARPGHPDDDFVARAQRYRDEHEATHEDEMCGGPCIVLGLADRADPLTPDLAERIAGAIADISEEWAESAEWLAARIMERLNDPDALPLRAATPDPAEPGHPDDDFAVLDAVKALRG